MVDIFKHCKRFIQTSFKNIPRSYKDLLQITLFSLLCHIFIAENFIFSSLSFPILSLARRAFNPPDINPILRIIFIGKKLNKQIFRGRRRKAETILKTHHAWNINNR